MNYDAFDDIGLRNLINQQIKYCDLDGKGREDLIELLNNYDNIRKQRFDDYQNLTVKELKKSIEERLRGDEGGIFMFRYNTPGYLKKNFYVTLMVDMDEAEEENKRYKELKLKKEKERIESEKQIMESEKQRRDAQRKLILDNLKLGKSLDKKIKDLKEKEDKTMDDYCVLVDLLEQRLATKREKTRIVDLV